MTENASTAHEAWGDGAAERVDIAVLETRRAVFPLHGLDPDDPRD
jgi:acetoin utilization protein AcuC